MKNLTYLLFLLAIFSTASFAKESERKAKIQQRIDSYQRKMRFYKGSKQFLSRAAVVYSSLRKSSEKAEDARNSGNASRQKFWERVKAKRQKSFENYKIYWNKRFKKNFGNMELEEAITWYRGMEQMSSIKDTVGSLNPPKLTRKEAISSDLRERFPPLQTAIDAGQEILEDDRQGVSGL